MKGWKVWVGVALMAAAHAIVPLLAPQWQGVVTDALTWVGGLLATVGMGHKLDRITGGLASDTPAAPK